MKKIKFRYVMYNEAYQIQYLKLGWWIYLSVDYGLHTEIITRDNKEKILNCLIDFKNYRNFETIEYPMRVIKTHFSDKQIEFKEKLKSL